ncbi:hypothetical protein AcV7_000460 [Taiwanofungus camphoratus]|nr:hypothetical protein AcV7_000460 [Antrodia cinnamomea]
MPILIHSQFEKHGQQLEGMLVRLVTAKEYRLHESLGFSTINGTILSKSNPTWNDEPIVVPENTNPS